MMAIRTDIKTAMEQRLIALGYTIAPLSTKFNRYTQSQYPLIKIVFDGVSKVVNEYAHNRRHRSDNCTILVIPYNTIDDFETKIDDEMEKMDSAFADINDIKSSINQLINITINDVESIIPDISSDSSKPFAMVRVSCAVDYMTV